jgi:hypothetical protein
MLLKIMFFAHDPGGANAISPLIPVFKQRGHDVFVFGAGPALKKLPGVVELKDYVDTIETLHPDFIITGTSANDFTEKKFWALSEKLKIPSMAILDHWCNYGLRFSKYGLRDIKEYNADRSIDFLPSYICVMDDFAKKEIVAEGVPEEKVYALGNPYFETLCDKVLKSNLAKIRKEILGEANQKIITFMSEPYEEDYGSGPERKVLNDLYKIAGNDPNIKLVVKLHPKESKDKYASIKNIKIISDMDSLLISAVSDIVVSMTSMALIEAVIIGRKAVSYQPAEKDKDRFILTRNDVLPFITCISELEKCILNLLKIEKMTYTFGVEFGAIHNIAEFVEKCRN